MTQNERLIITQNIKAQLDGAPVAPICVSGHPGTGKSTIVELIAKDLDMNFTNDSAPTMTHEILSGLPDTVDAPEFQNISLDQSVPKATQWSIPEMIVKASRLAKEKPTVLLVDDFHMVSPHLQAYFYGLLLERRLGNYKLPSNVAIVLTMNDSESAGFGGINSAVRNRMAILRVEFNFDYWLSSYGNRLHYLVASFLKTKSNYCMEEESTGIIGYATARAWTAIAAELKYHTDDFILSQSSIIAGMQVSQEAARAFQLHVNYISAIDFTRVVANKELTDLSSKDPLDSIIYAYITNFIYTVDDGLYLFKLMSKNIGQSAFIGFILGELYIKYTNQDDAPLSEGLTFIIDRLLSSPMDKSKYEQTSLPKLEKAFEEPIENLSEFMEKASEYLL
jgi:MoxR-like ATPase